MPATDSQPVTPYEGTRAACALTAAIVTTLVAAAYLPAVGAGLGFVSDDFMILQRVRELGGLRGASTYFAQAYYEYFRPMGFLSFAADWSLWGDTAWASHGVSVLLHILNTLLVLLTARRLIGLRAAALAAALFGLHAAHHEAVYWFSARFDLLATAGVLTAIVVLDRGRRWSFAGTAVLYLAALLSKESAATLPLVAGAFVLWVGGGDTKRLVRLFVPLAAAAIVYGLLRQASGLPSTGGLSRLPKLIALGALPALLIVLSLPSAARAVARARRYGWELAGAALVVLAGAAWWSAVGLPGGSALRRLFASAGFAAVHMGSPVAMEGWLSPLPPWLWLGGVATFAAAIVVFRLAINHPTAMYLAWFTLATLIPVSSMTEGTRYLYLPFVPVAMALGWGARWAEARWRGPVRLLLAVGLATGSWQVYAKGHDWVWAARMTRDAASTIAAHASPCRANDVVLAAAPARVRGVYGNLNYEALQWLQACTPRSMRTILRLGVQDAHIEAAWLAPGALTLRVNDYRGGFVTSADLVSFSLAVSPTRPLRLTNALGPFSAVPAADGSAVVVTQHMPPESARRVRWFVFSNGRLHSIDAGTR
ncbi:MAG: hypothetical protein Q7V01_02860 [Vicinamibacterales bacterium]|nr:hypothetical protein [Vicinamibacterales bacterium]